MRITPFQKPDEKIVTPLHQFIQDYNGKQFLLMLFACKKFNKKFCHFNGTEKKAEYVALPKQFCIGESIYSYEDGKWLKSIWAKY